MSNAVETLERALGECREGFSLPGVFYSDPGIFELECNAFLNRQWFVAAHQSELPNQGDYVVVEVAGASIILVRGRDGELHAMHNSCRHRGALICVEPKGSVRQLTCRYHAWAYRLDGSLQAWRHMPEGLDKADFGLVRCGVETFEGFIFISLDPANAPDFSVLTAHLKPYWAPYHLAECKVVHSETYHMQANWKLAIENNLECYHCLPSHPEYSSVSGFVRADEKISPAAIEAHAAHRAKLENLLAGLGMPSERSEIRWVGGQLARAGIIPLSEGVGTASKGGEPVAPLLGELLDYNEGTTTGAFGFTSYLFAANDYALSATYIPRDAGRTDVVAKWLVRADAVEGKDYDLDALRWLWDETTKQDKAIIELNARGVETRGYQPGPYAELEAQTAEFVSQYLRMMRETARG